MTLNTEPQSTTFSKIISMVITWDQIRTARWMVASPFMQNMWNSCDLVSNSRCQWRYSWNFIPFEPYAAKTSRWIFSRESFVASRKQTVIKPPRRTTPATSAPFRNYQQAAPAIRWLPYEPLPRWFVFPLSVFRSKMRDWLKYIHEYAFLSAFVYQ